MNSQTKWREGDYSKPKPAAPGSDVEADRDVVTMTIYPYLTACETWVFDDRAAGLKAEAFVLGMSEMISRLVEFRGIARAKDGFALTFAAQPFDHDVVLAWQRADDEQWVAGPEGTPVRVSGNWYSGMVADKLMEGWLCPALFCYFPTDRSAPQQLFVKAEPLPAGVNPIWEVSRDEPIVKQFVSGEWRPGGES